MVLPGNVSREYYVVGSAQSFSRSATEKLKRARIARNLVFSLFLTPTIFIIAALNFHRQGHAVAAYLFLFIACLFLIPQGIAFYMMRTLCAEAIEKYEQIEYQHRDTLTSVRGFELPIAQQQTELLRAAGQRAETPLLNFCERDRRPNGMPERGRWKTLITAGVIISAVWLAVGNAGR